MKQNLKKTLSTLALAGALVYAPANCDKKETYENPTFQAQKVRVTQPETKKEDTYAPVTISVQEAPAPKIKSRDPCGAPEIALAPGSEYMVVANQWAINQFAAHFGFEANTLDFSKPFDSETTAFSSKYADRLELIADKVDCSDFGIELAKILGTEPQRDYFLCRTELTDTILLNQVTNKLKDVLPELEEARKRHLRERYNRKR